MRESIQIAVLNLEHRQIDTLTFDNEAFMAFVNRPPRVDGLVCDFAVMKAEWVVATLSRNKPTPVFYGDALSCVTYMVQETYNDPSRIVRYNELSIYFYEDGNKEKTVYVFYIVPITDLSEEQLNNLIGIC